jgi:Protein of unknown function (DUF2656)
MIGRMLLSHNFNLSPDRLPVLSREQFAAVFRSMDSPTRLIDHPHWIVEVRFEHLTPLQVGDQVLKALMAFRRTQTAEEPDFLVLGGIKTTPPTSADPEALQPGEWGVDVVETESGEAFLSAIEWETTIAAKSPDTIFKVTGNQHV